MASAKYSAFIERVAAFGLPVKFLKEVEAGYTIVPGNTSLVLPWFDVMMLDPDEFNAMEQMKAPRVGAGTGIENIYHESTHAWIDMNSRRSDVAKLVTSGSAYYQNAPMQQEAQPDPERIFQEAIASYVGHRVATYWSAIETTANMEYMLKKHNGSPERQRADRLTLERVPGRYDSAMSQRVFGFQSSCAWCAQNPTKQVLSSSIKRFADATLLENKVPDNFSQTGRVLQRWTKAAKR